MNTLRVLSLALLLALGLSTSSFADQVQGFVESIDSSSNSILIKDPVSGSAKSVRVHPKVISGVKKGSVAKVIYKPGDNQAETVEVLMAR